MGPALAHRTARRTPASSVAGFTLVEILVALAIISVIMGVVLTGNASFNKSILLNEAAYGIATSIREAQSLGIANRGMNTNAGYGFQVSPGESGVSAYDIFSDFFPYQWDENTCYPSQDPNLPSAKPGNCRYDAEMGELVKHYTLREGFTIAKVCGTHQYYGYIVCSDNSGQNVQEVDIVFSRPNTDAIMTAYAYDGSPLFRLSLTTIYVRGQDGALRCVTVRDTGQIAVPQTCP